MSEWVSTPQSSNISGYCYDKTSQTLTVEFNNGSRYNYYDVPETIVKDMQFAESVGKYLNSKVKGHYRYARQ